MLTYNPDPNATLDIETGTPAVSVLMPCLNESKYLRGCLESLLYNDYLGQFEITVIDGGSTDGTLEIIREFCANDRRVKMLANPRRTAPTALNLAIPQASGEVIVRVDAHALYPANYISRCVTALLESGAANVGGVWRIVPGLPTKLGWTIAKVQAQQIRSGKCSLSSRYVDGAPMGRYSALPLLQKNPLRRSRLLQRGTHENPRHRIQPTDPKRRGRHPFMSRD